MISDVHHLSATPDPGHLQLAQDCFHVWFSPLKGSTKEREFLCIAVRWRAISFS